MVEVNCSYFDVMNIIEIGVGIQFNGIFGWLMCYLVLSLMLFVGVEMLSFLIGDLQLVLLLQSYEIVNVVDLNLFNINFGLWNWIDEQKVVFQMMWDNDVSWLYLSGV